MKAPILPLLLCSIALADRPAFFSERVPYSAGARECYIAPDGKAENSGTKDAPWDLASALANAHKNAPGDILYVLPGTYTGKFDLKLIGSDKAPVHVIAVGRATVLDSGLTVNPPADYVWLWNLEIASSIPIEKRETKQTGSQPSDLPGKGGLDVYGGSGCKYINLVIHDNVGGGVGFWAGATDSEFHGCIIYNNGWRGPDRGHGHCIYTQNKDGTKTISNCIMSVPFNGSYTMHAYGSKAAYLDNFTVEDNIAFGKGPFLIGGGRPSHNIIVRRNYLHGVGMMLGYGAQNEDVDVRDNIVADGRIELNKWNKVVDEGNLRGMPAAKAILIPSKYDATRAHVAVYNGAGAAKVSLDVSSWLRPGDVFKRFPAMDVFGQPVLSDRCQGRTIDIPMTASFAAFVLVKS